MDRHGLTRTGLEGEEIEEGIRDKNNVGSRREAGTKKCWVLDDGGELIGFILWL